MAVKTRMAKALALSAMVFATAIRVASAQVGPIEDLPLPACRETQSPAIVAAWARPAAAVSSARDQTEAGANRLVLGTPNQLTLLTRDLRNFRMRQEARSNQRSICMLGLRAFRFPRTAHTG